MKRAIIGGIVTLVIGGTGFSVSQADIVKNFAKETGMSQDQAQKYVNDTQKDLVSFSKIGQGLIDDARTISTTTSTLDCDNYTYEWVTPTLSCIEGKSELETISGSEVVLGNCYQALDTDLGKTAKTKINECIDNIDTVNKNYDLPIAIKVLNTSEMADAKNTNIYNKSVLRAALESK